MSAATELMARRAAIAGKKIPKEDVLLYEYATNSDYWDGYVASSSGNFSGYETYKCFKEGVSRYEYDSWAASATGAGKWVQIKLPKPRVCRSFGVEPRTDGNMVTQWVLMGSNDGSSFDTLCSIGKIGSSEKGDFDEVVTQFDNAKPYMYYRLSMPKILRDRCSVGRFRIYGY